MEPLPIYPERADLDRIAAIFLEAGCNPEPNYALDGRLIMSGYFLLSETDGPFEDEVIDFAIFFEDGQYKGQVDNMFDDVGPESKITQSFSTMDEAAGFIIGEIDHYLNSGAY